MKKLGSPEVILLGVVFLLFPIAHYNISIFGLPLYFSEIPLLLAAGIVVWQGRKESHWKEDWETNKMFFLGSGLFLLGAILSYGANEQTLTGLGMLKSFFFLPVVFSWLLIWTIKTGYRGEKVLWMWLAGLSLMAWISITFAMNGHLTYDGRLSGIYESPNYLAMLLAPGILLSMYFWQRGGSRMLKNGSIFFLVVLSIAVFLTHSYGAIGSLLIALSIFLWLSRKIFHLPIKKGILALLLLLVVFSAFILPTEKFQTLIQGGERSSWTSREMIWTSALQIGKDHFFFGVGPGNFQTKYLEYQKYFSPYLEWAVPQPHNLYLALWLQTGIVGLFGFLTILTLLFRRWYTKWKQKNLSQEERLLGALFISLFVFYLLYGLVDTPYFKNDLALAVWGSVGLLWGWGQQKG